MTARDLHVYSTEAGGAAAVPSTAASQLIDWRALRRADRSCCCPARPAVIVVMPTVPGRPHLTDLLLCGHHYRVSRLALASAGATTYRIDGASITAGARPPAGIPA